MPGKKLDLFNVWNSLCKPRFAGLERNTFAYVN